MIWRIPSADQVNKLMASTLVTIGSTFAAVEGSNRADTALPLVVLRIRGAVLAGGRTPLETDPEAVPPEALQFTLLLTLRILFASVPPLMAVVQDRRPDFVTQCETAEKWIESVTLGKTPVTHPTTSSSTLTGTHYVASTKVDVGTDG
jgi:hypothetical protein